VVRRQQSARYNQGPDAAPPGQTRHADPHDGDYIHLTTTKTDTDLLPGAHLSVDFSNQRAGRLAAARTMTRADDTDLAGAVEPQRPRDAACQPQGPHKGIEIAWQQPIGDGFGLDLNCTDAVGRDSNGAPLAGSSRHTCNAEGWYENDILGGRLIYSVRPDFLTGIVSALPQYAAGSDDVSASLNFKLTGQLSLSLDAKNLAGTLARQYVVRKDMPAAIYNNGKQFYLGLKYSL